MSFFYRLDTNVYYSNSRYIGLITNRHPAAQTGFGYNTTNRKARQFYQNYRAIMAEMERFACICALRETAQIEEFTSVRTGSCTCRRHVRLHIRISPNPFPKGNSHPFGWLFPFGGDGEIRTLEELLTPTRFPIVRARPTTRHLRVAQETKLFNCQLAYYNARTRQSQGIFFRKRTENRDKTKGRTSL